MSALEEQVSSPRFWDDNQAAQTILQEVSAHKKWIGSFQKLASELSDIEQLIDMAGPDVNSGDAQELDSVLRDLAHELDRLEVTALLSGPDDQRDAIVTIHPGAGGTESQDWAEMLFRMYNRWAERKQFAAELMDFQPGEEAGLKSAT
ncbi:MAG TPA: PCRF domain-containing protein, partial [Candidatus Deferrimicrobium sp.]|nr:PCRF domain-containing protein [Candidatus Deferrimicrobium sp.]